MIKKLFSTLSLLLCIYCFQLWGNTNNTENPWDILLNDVKIKYSYSVVMDAYFPRPKFGDELKKLDGKEITIKGFFLPLDITGDIFVVSYNPMNMCFFCTGTGIETIIEVNVLDEYVNKFNRLKTDDFISIRGTLKLNRDDYEHLVYILDDVELLGIEK